MIAWDDARLRYGGDTPRRAKYRLLQSWYREHILKVEPGLGPGDAPNGAWLLKGDVEKRPELNFLDDSAIWNVAKTRLGEATGAFEPDRLCRSLLSSQPLCVNLFGRLKLAPHQA